MSLRALLAAAAAAAVATPHASGVRGDPTTHRPGCSAAGDDWGGCRQHLIAAALGKLPTRTFPDYQFEITPRVAPSRRQASSGETRAAPALGNNGGGMGGVTRNTTALVWTIADGPLSLNATVYWTLNTTGSAVAPYPTVVCSTTQTFLPPCRTPAASVSDSDSPAGPSTLCLNVGVLPNHTAPAFFPLQLFECQTSGASSNEAFILHETGSVSTGWPVHGCLDALPAARGAPPPSSLVCNLTGGQHCAVVADACDAGHPTPSQQWSVVPVPAGSVGSPASTPPKVLLVNRDHRTCLSATNAAVHAGIVLVDCKDPGTPAALREWVLLPQGHVQLAATAAPPGPPGPEPPTCCSAEYVAPATSFGHFRGQDHVAFPAVDGVPQGPYSLPMTGADTGPLDLPMRRTKTLVLYHNGHGQLWVPNVTTGEDAADPLCVREPELGEPRLTARWHAECWYNWDTTPGWLSELGYDVMELNMPLLGPNNNGSMGTRSHEWFASWEAKGVKTMRFFVEPVSLAINFAVAQGYENFVLVGLSGGGWSTTLASALDKRIGLSFPIAGSLPFALRENKWHDGGDFEQSAARPIYQACDYECMYTLAGLEPGRLQVQLLHEADPCCFRSGPRHADIIAYNDEVAKRLGAAGASNRSSGGAGTMCTVATAGNVHEVNMRDKAVIAYLIDRYDQWGSSALPKASECAALPFNVLHRW